VAQCGGVFDHRQELTERLHQTPAPSAPTQPAPSRWTLRRIGAAFDWLTGYSLSGVWRVLHSAGIGLRSARVQAFSPDPEYQAKVERLTQVLHEAAAAPGEIEVLFLDQMGYGRWPEAAAEWTEQAPAPRRVAQRKGSNERKWRLIGSLNARNGQVTTLDNYIVGRKQVIRFLRLLDATYADARRIYVVLDNWSIHRHEEVQEALALLPRLEVVWLPTYAPWLNPIEKLWRWIRQDILYLHQQADEWDVLQQRLRDFLAQFASGSQEVLQYVGLLGDGLLAQARRGL
jgi:DDE superfamily endonuclease